MESQISEKSHDGKFKDTDKFWPMLLINIALVVSFLVALALINIFE